MLLTSAVISGLGLGSMYGLIALGFHVTYVVSNTVNFSQGSAMLQVEIEHVASIVTVHPVDPQLQQDVGLLGAEMVLEELGRAAAVEDVTVQEAVTSGLEILLLRRCDARACQDDCQHDGLHSTDREIAPRPQEPILLYGKCEARGAPASSRHLSRSDGG